MEMVSGGLGMGGWQGSDLCSPPVASGWGALVSPLDLSP